MGPSACSGPRLAPPINETAKTARIPGTSPGVDVLVLEVGDQPGIFAGRCVARRNNPTTTPAAAVTAIHHHCPPNQPGSESVYQLPPHPVTPMNTKSGERADDAQADRERHQDPELPPLRKRR